MLTSSLHFWSTANNNNVLIRDDDLNVFRLRDNKAEKGVGEEAKDKLRYRELRHGRSAVAAFDSRKRTSALREFEVLLANFEVAGEKTTTADHTVFVFSNGVLANVKTCCGGAEVESVVVFDNAGAEEQAYE